MSVSFIGRYRPQGRIRIRRLVEPAPPTAPTWVINQGNLGTYAEGSLINIQMSVADPNNDIVSYIVTAGALPPGLTLNQFSGLISGTLEGVDDDQQFSFSVRVTDATGFVLNGSFYINVVNSGTEVVWVTPEGLLAEPSVGESYFSKLEAESR